MLLLHVALFFAQAAPLGVFEGHTDLGTVLTPGTVVYEQNAYRVTGSGDNMWAASDSFHYVWKKATGDVTLTAQIAFATAGGNAHKKGVLMIRQSLDADSAYCDAALHGNGLASLQCRERQSGPTYEIQQAITGAKTLRLEKRGAYFYVAAGNDPKFTGGSVKLPMEEPFYIGLGVCAHDKDAVEQVTFSNLVIGTPLPDHSVMRSTLEIAPVRGDRRAIYVAEGIIEAPTWSADGQALLFTKDGKTQRIAITGGIPTAATSLATQLQFRVAKHRGRQHIYSETARKWLTKTKAEGNNRNPVVTPDGKYILFDSDRSGQRQIWRMAPDGSHPEQVTKDNRHNWLPRPSPDGTRLAMLSADTAPEPKNRTQEIAVRLLADQAFASLAKITGGPGTSPQWSPDNRFLTFISYQTGPR